MMWRRKFSRQHWAMHLAYVQAASAARALTRAAPSALFCGIRVSAERSGSECCPNQLRRFRTFRVCQRRRLRSQADRLFVPLGPDVPAPPAPDVPPEVLEFIWPVPR
jgi:hypothetical protein